MNTHLSNYRKRMETERSGNLPSSSERILNVSLGKGAIQRTIDKRESRIRFFQTALDEKFEGEVMFWGKRSVSVGSPGQNPPLKTALGKVASSNSLGRILEMSLLSNPVW